MLHCTLNMPRGLTNKESFISNFYNFKEEARQLTLQSYHRHKNGVHDESLTSSLPAWPMISSEVAMWLSRISRRMSANPKASNPWTIEVSNDLPQEIFEFLRKSVQGHPQLLAPQWRTKWENTQTKIVSCVIFQVKLQRNLRRGLEGTIKVLKLRCL